MEPVPEIRIRLANDLPINAEGKLVLYWMTAFRRRNWNFSLQRAVQWAAELGKPLVVLEALRCDYPWASDRLHRFIIEGMADNLRDLASPGVCYYPFVEQRKGEGKASFGPWESMPVWWWLMITRRFSCLGCCRRRPWNSGSNSNW